MKRGKTHWNYRIVTKMVKHEKFPDWRSFSITEVYYTNGKPNSYIEPINQLSGNEHVKELKWTLKKMKKALKKSVLDLDHWPKKYILGSDIVVTNDLYS